MRVFIVEDNDSMRFILNRLLKTKIPSITDIGQSESAEKALEKIPAFKADLLLVDISLPGMNGIALVSRLRQTCDIPFIVVMTSFDLELYKEPAKRVGADILLSKNELDKLIRSVGELLTTADKDLKSGVKKPTRKTSSSIGGA